MLDTERDLALAANEIEKMASATLLQDLQSAWETFVFRLERTWGRTERMVRAIPGRDAQSWISVNSKLRRTDPLLIYLKQARNAETHAVSTSIDMDRVVSLSDKFGRPFNLKDVSISLERKTLTIDVTSYDIGIDWQGGLEPGNPQLQTIVNRGQKYEPPDKHLGNRLVDKHPVAVATFGLNFYKGAYTAISPILDRPF